MKMAAAGPVEWREDLWGELAGDLGDDCNKYQLIVGDATLDWSPRGLTMQANNGEDESQTQNQNDDRVDSETRALVRVKLEHRSRRSTGTGRTSRCGPRIPQGFLVVCSSTATEGSSRSTRRRGRRRPVRGGSWRTSGRTRVGRLGVGTGLSTGGERRRRTRWSLLETRIRDQRQKLRWKWGFAPCVNREVAETWMEANCRSRTYHCERDERNWSQENNGATANLYPEKCVRSKEKQSKVVVDERAVWQAILWSVWVREVELAKKATGHAASSETDQCGNPRLVLLLLWPSWTN